MPQLDNHIPKTARPIARNFHRYPQTTMYASLSSILRHLGSYLFIPLLLSCLLTVGCTKQSRPPLNTSYGDSLIHGYFRTQITQIERTWDEHVTTREDWEQHLTSRRQELRKMLGIDNRNRKTPLNVTVTDTVEGNGFHVLALHYQSIPNLYVTANLYIPNDTSQPVPGILYLSGHATRYHDNVSLGPKSYYQYHPAWYAQHGYVTLILDTIQLGEIEATHHGTYRKNRWWWLNRGYTPLGVEIWNSIRGLDYLASRPEVDTNRLAATGRSGGGAYSWFLTAVDTRIQTAVPTAGIADLENYVVDQIILKHCDCMFVPNTERWNFSMVAALAAPRPVLLANGNHDPLFPLDGVTRVFHKVRQVYGLYGAIPNWQRLIVDAPHEDIPPLRQGTYRWMHKQLKDRTLTGTDSSKRWIEPRKLKVFDQIPEDEINTSIDEQFIRTAPSPQRPRSIAEWKSRRDQWMNRLQTGPFSGWPTDPEAVSATQLSAGKFSGMHLSSFQFETQKGYPLRFWVLRTSGDTVPDTLQVSVVDSLGWQNWLGILRAATSRQELHDILGRGARATPWPDPDPQALADLRNRLREDDDALVVFPPRGIGPTRWSQEKPGYGVRRSFPLIGQTRDGMRVWDVQRLVQAVGTIDPFANSPVHLEAFGPMAGIVTYASIVNPRPSELHLYQLPTTHRQGPFLLRIRTLFDTPQAVAMALDSGNRTVYLHNATTSNWTWPHNLANQTLEEPDKLQFRPGTSWLVGP